MPSSCVTSSRAKREASSTMTTRTPLSSIEQISKAAPGLDGNPAFRGLSFSGRFPPFSVLEQASVREAAQRYCCPPFCRGAGARTATATPAPPGRQRQRQPTRQRSRAQRWCAASRAFFLVPQPRQIMALSETLEWCGDRYGLWGRWYPRRQAKGYRLVHSLCREGSAKLIERFKAAMPKSRRFPWRATLGV